MIHEIVLYFGIVSQKLDFYLTVSPKHNNYSLPIGKEDEFNYFCIYM